MRNSVQGILLVIAVILAAAVAAQPAQQPTAPQTAAFPPVPDYPDSAGGLEKFMKTVLEAGRKEDNQIVYAHTRSLILPDPEATFGALFGDVLPVSFASEYKKRSSALYLVLGRDLMKIAQEGYEEIRVRRYEEGCSSLADENQTPVLLARKQPAAFYDVRILKKKDDKTATGLWYFVYQDGGFRYLGNITVPQGAPVFGSLPATDVSDTAQPAERIRIAGNVQAAKLIEKPGPVYPQQAKNARLQGTVRLMAVIAKDGRVNSLRLVRGHCWLAQAAIDAVKQWRYQPALLNGEPVEVVTTIDVVFSLTNR